MALLYKTLSVMVSGYKEAGKTLFSKMLVTEMKEHGWNVYLFPLAEPLKQIALRMGWDGVKDERGRRLLQTLGVEVGRAYDEDLWVKKLINETVLHAPGYPFDSIVIDDWRFPNERDYIKKNPLYDVVTIRIFRPDTGGDPHSSETALPLDIEHYDSVIYNTGDIYSLQRSAIATFEHLDEVYNKGVK